VAGVYLVIDAGLSASQLLLIGVAQSIVALVFEIPAGVVADTISRKWSLVAAQLMMGTAMMATGLVTDFVPLLATQMLWGLSWTLASGSDVAWITDELADPTRISVVLTRSGRAQLTGAAAGIVLLGVLASVTARAPTMVFSGAAMILAAVYVLVRFPERGFVPTRTKRWSSYWSTFLRGLAVVRGSRVLLVMVGATFLVDGAADAFARLHQRRLIDIGFPAEPLVWFSALSVTTLLAGAVALRTLERHVDGPRATRRAYLLACGAGMCGFVALAAAPEVVTGGLAALAVGGLALPLTRTIRTIWVNRQASDATRTTVHSFLAQAEYAGEILCGSALALIARFMGLPLALLACAAMFAATIGLVRLLGTARGT
jgi:MFS family permease